MSRTNHYLLITFLFLVSNSPSTKAQTVGTITLSQNITGDGIVKGPDGNLYVAGGWNQNMIYKIDNTGNVSIVSSGLTSPVSLIFKPGTDTLLVSNWETGIINTLSLNGTLDTLVILPFGPGGMVFDSLGNLYVAHNKGAILQSGGISKVFPDGSWLTFADGGDIHNPVGLVIDEFENLFCANLKDGRITKIDTAGNQTLIATIASSGTFKVGYITYLDSTIYATALSGNEIYKVTTSGTVSLYAGTGVYGFLDGPVSLSTFTNPNGICFSQTMDTLFIRETLQANNRIRFITALQANLNQEQPNSDNLKVYPNPAINKTTISFSLTKATNISVIIYDQMGKEIKTLLNKEATAGNHIYEWDCMDDQGNKVAPGTYLCSLTTASTQQTIQLVVTK